MYLSDLVFAAGECEEGLAVDGEQQETGLTFLVQVRDVGLQEPPDNIRS